MSRSISQPDSDPAREFEDARPRLLGLAYRILGSMADAEDAAEKATDIYIVRNPDKLVNLGAVSGLWSSSQRGNPGARFAGV